MQLVEEIAASGMEQMSEFLVMAATLLEIRSRMLLPKPPAPDAEPEEDPHDALARKQHCQVIAKANGRAATRR